MIKHLPVYLLILLLLVGGLVFFIKQKDVENTVAFSDIQVDFDENALNQIASGYISLPSLSADGDSIEALIGGVVIRSRSINGDEVWSYDMRYRPSKELVFSKLVDEKLYHGVVTAKASFGGKLKVASSNTSAEDLADVTIRNQLIAGYKNPSDIPFKALSKISITPDKDYYFIESVVVTDITTRRFSKQTSEGKIQGMAFGANGSIYSEKGILKSQKIISFRPINLLDLQASEAGGSNEIKLLTSKSRRERLSEDEAFKLIDSLREKAKTVAPPSVPLGRPHADLPSRLNGLEPIVWYKNTYQQRQTSNSRCWAAVTAMMFSWKKQRLVNEVEAVASLGSAFESLYNRDGPLPKSYKLSLLQASGMTYRAPQSYTQQGLISLLENYGPVWFTIDKEFGRHATVLTGVFLDQKNTEYWVAYIDPIDGELKADTYISYMRRYEAPAYRANEESIDIAMTEQDLDIQVVHWK